MHHATALGGIELITGISYLSILIGFALRQYLEMSTARLLWPWMLISIFGLCGVTRLEYVGVIALPEVLIAASHLILAVVALGYGTGQLLYAFWPELFEDDTPLPQLAREEIPDGAPAEEAQICGSYEAPLVAPRLTADVMEVTGPHTR